MQEAPLIGKDLEAGARTSACARAPAALFLDMERVCDKPVIAFLPLA
jgi:hypothetical protein